MLDQEAIDNLQRQLADHRRRLAQRLRQRAIQGVAHVLPEVETDIEEARVAIRQLKEALRTRGVIVVDQPDDEERMVSPSLPRTKNPLIRLRGAGLLTAIIAAITVLFVVAWVSWRTYPPPLPPTVSLAPTTKNTGVAQAQPTAAPASVRTNTATPPTIAASPTSDALSLIRDIHSTITAKPDPGNTGEVTPTSGGQEIYTFTYSLSITNTEGMNYSQTDLIIQPKQTLNISSYRYLNITFKFDSKDESSPQGLLCALYLIDSSYTNDPEVGYGNILLRQDENKKDADISVVPEPDGEFTTWIVPLNKHFEKVNKQSVRQLGCTVTNQEENSRGLLGIHTLTIKDIFLTK